MLYENAAGVIFTELPILTIPPGTVFKGSALGKGILGIGRQPTVWRGSIRKGRRSACLASDWTGNKRGTGTGGRNAGHLLTRNPILIRQKACPKALTERKRESAKGPHLS